MHNLSSSDCSWTSNLSFLTKLQRWKSMHWESHSRKPQVNTETKLPKMFIFASEASYFNFPKTFGCTFLPLIISVEFLQILGNLQYKKNHQEFKRIFKGQNCITKGLQSNRLVNDKTDNFLRDFQTQLVNSLFFYWHTFKAQKRMTAKEI